MKSTMLSNVNGQSDDSRDEKEEKKSETDGREQFENESANQGGGVNIIIQNEGAQELVAFAPQNGDNQCDRRED